ncbi:MAG: type II toxin-antitoxin system HicB family antitoxin [Ekhidna sp.]|nr:type II toxin-antitoxin system HicB family antitoxin [Ekhidna sp.]MBC6410472.1 type II toxin-antitoxin system HicB family antitoxin [Ekhidna sp.]
MKLTALIEKSDGGWFVGQLEELPEVLSQGETVELHPLLPLTIQRM